jgi:thiol-disulfide isomerase/thioredoxin
MKTAALRYLGGTLIVLLGIWAGLKFHSVHRVSEPMVAVPAGVASAPDPKENSALEAVPHPVVPARLPDFALNDLSGKPTSIDAWSGKSLVINFWATWCAPCRREIPLLKTLASDWAGRDLEVIGIAVDYVDKVRPFAEQFKIDYPRSWPCSWANCTGSRPISSCRRSKISIRSAFNSPKRGARLPMAWKRWRERTPDSSIRATFAAEACLFTSISGYYRGPL